MLPVSTIHEIQLVNITQSKHFHSNIPKFNFNRKFVLRKKYIRNQMILFAYLKMICKYLIYISCKKKKL